MKAGLFGTGSGGLLLSFNGLSSIAVMDIDTRKIVWARVGYWHHQHDPDLLDNGNVLISEFESGRLIEVTREGKIVWEYSCPFHSEIDPDYVCNFVAGRRYDRGALNFDFNSGNPR